MSHGAMSQEQLRAALMKASVGSNNAQNEQKTKPRSGAPRHPIASMQGPFEESIDEASHPPDTRAQDAFNKLKPKARRQRLLDTESTNGTYNEQWRSDTSGPRFHPLTKIISQIAFGVHLLHQQLARSDEEVVKILQKHVDDVDNFVQRAEEDLDLAITDVRERISYLKLPLEHTNVFDVMLDDKTFRTQIIEGNEKIEKVVNRSAGFVKDLQVDVQKGSECTVEMGQYLDEIEEDWPQEDHGGVEIYSTMQANVEGWVQCMSALQMKGNGLSVAVVQLGSILSEMAKRAGSASRREQRRADRAAREQDGKFRSSSQHRPSSSSQRRSSGQGRSASQHRRKDSSSKHPGIDKPLPENPDLVGRVIEATLPGAKIPARERERKDKHYDSPRDAPSAPKSKPGSIRSTKTNKSTKSMREVKKPPPIHIDKMPPIKKSDAARAKLTDLANVFRFHGSGSTHASPLASPTLPPPRGPPPTAAAISPYMTPLTSPKLPRESPQRTGPQIQVEADSNALFELENEAQATLIQARSQLRQKSSEALSIKHPKSPKFSMTSPNLSLTSHPPSPGLPPIDPRPIDKFVDSPDPSEDATDSAYASSPEPETTQRPKTSPSSRPPPGGAGFGILASVSVTSLPSLANIEVDKSDADSLKEVPTALPQVKRKPIGSPSLKSPATTFPPTIAANQPKAPSPLRRGSSPSAPLLKKRTSLQALRKFFSRGRSASAEPSARIREQEEDASSARPATVAKVKGEAKMAVLEDLIELPG